MEEEFEKHKLDVDPNPEEEEEEENPEEKIKTHWNPLLIKAAQKGDLETMRKCLDKRANIFHEEKKWNALIWACSNGYVDMVRYLLEKGAGKPYLPKETVQPDNQQTHFSTMENEKPAEKQDKKVGQGVINNNARPTPLNWACFKGHVQVVNILLKAGLDMLETDTFGNNAIHQAVAGANTQVIETLLQYGVKIDSKNNRGHTVFDLSTEPKNLKLLKEYENSAVCAGTNKPFVAGDIKYYCIITGKYFSKEGSELYWIYEKKDSTEAEKLERRSHKAQEEIVKIEGELAELIGTYDYDKLCDKMAYIANNKIHVGVKLLEKANIHEEKLKTQIEINKYIDSLSEVENYKTIRKSINTIQEMIEDARMRKVDLDADLVNRANREMERLEAERNLRFVLDNPAISKSTPEEVERIQDIKRVALDKGVAVKYCEELDQLLDKMTKNIDANTIISNFCNYPIREWYPPPHIKDAKTGKYLDPVTKKPIDPNLMKAPVVKKKRGKKAPKFVIPDWAIDTAELGKAIKNLEDLLLQVAEIEVDGEVLAKSTEQMTRMKMEFKERKRLDEEARIEAEKKAKNKKKK